MAEQTQPEAKAKTVEVELLKTHVHQRKTYTKGEKITVRDDQAKRLREKGVAK